MFTQAVACAPGVIVMGISTQSLYFFYCQAISSVEFLTPVSPTSFFPTYQSCGPSKLLYSPYIPFWPIWAPGSATWAHLMAPCSFPTIQVEYRPIVHLPSCSCKAGGLSCLCSLLPQSGKLVHLGYNGLLSHQYVVQERLWGVGLQHGFPLALTATFWKPVAHYN